MARGRKRYSNSRHNRGPKKRKVVISKKDVHHFKEFGEAHPSEESNVRARGRAVTKVVDEEEVHDLPSDSESEEEQSDPYKKLLLTLGPSEYTSKNKAVDSEDSSESSEEDVQEEVVSEDGASLEELTDDENSGSDMSPETVQDQVEKIDGKVEDDTEEKAIKLLDEELDDTSDDDECNEECEKVKDPFFKHLNSELCEEMLENLSCAPTKLEKNKLHWPNLGQIIVYLPTLSKKIVSDSENKILAIDVKVYAQSATSPKIIETKEKTWSFLHIKPRLQKNLLKANPCGVPDVTENEINFSSMQNELFSIINSYKDLYFPERNYDCSEEVRFVYVLHAVNHVLKTRSEILKHNSLIEKKQDIPDEFRDQGLVRPKVLILVPFRETALRVVKMIISILAPNKKDNVLNKKRFFDEFTGGEIAMPKKNPKPEDYERLFSGNADDNFKLGLSITKKSLKLYSDFYASDILLASPLGLRVLIGAEGEKDRDFDYLASLELLVMDGADVFAMQNWDHVMHLTNHLHLQPSAASTTRSGTDFSRVRPWAVEGHSSHYRQTIVISSTPLPGPAALFATKCKNYEGAVRVANPVPTGSISEVIVQMPQVFHRIDVQSATEAIDARFKLFTTKVLPQYKDKITKHVLIYIPQYFDYIRIRNYLEKEDISFVQICEYSKEGRVAQARDHFFHGKSHFLLYSERFHYFRRVRIKGIKHIIFYQPPSYPQFYSEMCNLMQAAYQRRNQRDSHNSVALLYSRHDLEQLAGIVGSDRASKMMTSVDRNVHMFVTGE
ncbi:hypothetical protein J437_LFUL002127 [Ladona fulva]|uniref:U3 small nucleolar RNA-associated protein 25 homolog n=1 Tax=Ladona fulva TaxID=123851 RepID=A0A8K0JSZ2_LADFU|nr:hypothetical protein J437_LFUL002127 [Ladona fulva]